MANPTLTLNGKPVEFTPGQTILEVAQANGVKIPTLCHLKGCTPTGACRVCLVEVK
ncbi:MAG: (2Fe-2S)-binding protein, partial [Desulfarculus sp.]|nr:(2Fe-2S)-binding protein [Desulfarculus sp.]